MQEVELDHTNKWYRHNSESVLEYETHEILWDFEIKTDHLISAKRQDLVIINKKKKKKKKKENLPNCELRRSGKTEGKRKER